MPNTAPMVTLREMTAADVPAVATLHVATFNETHTRNNNGPSYTLREQQWRNAFANHDGTWFGVVIEAEKGELIGFAKGCPHDGGVPGYAGELNKIYLLRRYHRLGLGRRLLAEVARRFLERGFESMLLFGDARSPTNGFYEAMGAERILAANSHEFHGSYGWRDLRALLARCEAGGQPGV
jgi:GNAT superfamily N-acetyltransferase